MITMTLKSLARSVAASSLFGLGALLATGAAVAQDLKIGYVNSERVLREATPAKAALARMEADFSKRDKDLNDQAAKLKAAADKLEKDAPTLPESERNRRQRELVEQDRDLQRKRREFQEDLNQRKNGWNSATKTDVSNLALALESAATDRGGDFRNVFSTNVAGTPLTISGGLQAVNVAGVEFQGTQNVDLVLAAPASPRRRLR